MKLLALPAASSACMFASLRTGGFAASGHGRQKNRLHTRVFAPKYGYLEDPATGSGNSAIGYYLMKNKLWDGTPISIEQGPSVVIPNIVKLNTIVTQHKKIQVLFGGRAMVRIDGAYLLQ